MDGGRWSPSNRSRRPQGCWFCHHHRMCREPYSVLGIRLPVQKLLFKACGPLLGHSLVLKDLIPRGHKEQMNTEMHWVPVLLGAPETPNTHQHVAQEDLMSRRILKSITTFQSPRRSPPIAGSPTRRNEAQYRKKLHALFLAADTTDDGFLTIVPWHLWSS